MPFAVAFAAPEVNTGFALSALVAVKIGLSLPTLDQEKPLLAFAFGASAAEAVIPLEPVVAGNLAPEAPPPVATGALLPDGTNALLPGAGGAEALAVVCGTNLAEPGPDVEALVPRKNVPPCNL